MDLIGNRTIKRMETITIHITTYILNIVVCFLIGYHFGKKSN